MTSLALGRMRWALSGGVRPTRRLRIDRALGLGALGFVGLMVPTLIAMAVDERVFQGANVWVKPLKFQVSLALYLGTLALYAAALPSAVRRVRAFRVYVALVIAACFVEITWIMAAAGVGVASHFNTDNALLADIYGAMGIVAILIISLALVMGVIIWRARTPRLATPLRLALGLGLVLTFLSTLLTAGYLASQPGHFVGAGEASMESGWLFGWARDGGDLRVPHFFAMHAMQVLPVLGWLLAARRIAHGLAFVWVGGVAYAGLIMFTFAEAVAGRPFLPTIL